MVCPPFQYNKLSPAGKLSTISNLGRNLLNTLGGRKPAPLPQLVSISVADATNTKADWLFDIDLDTSSIPDISDFSFSAKTGTGTVVISGKTVTTTFTERVYWGDVVGTGTYTKGTNPIKGIAGGEADSITATAITNNVELDASASALITRMIAASEEPTTARKIIINKTYIKAKAKAFWAKMDQVVTLAAHATMSARMNWIKNANNCLLVNAPTYTEDRGYATTASKIVDCNYIPKTEGVNYTKDSASIGFYETADERVNTQFVGRSSAGDYGGNEISINPHDPWNCSQAYMNGISLANLAHTDAGGLYVYTVYDSTHMKGYMPSGTTGVKNQSTNGLPSVKTYLGYVYGGGTDPKNGFFRFVFHGGGLTDQDAADIKEVFVDYYLNEIGAKI